MKRSIPTVDDNPYSVLKLSVTRLMHIREVQATGGGHFAQVARELGYVRKKQPTTDEELALLEKELAEAEAVRKKRNDALVERLKAARERLGASSEPPRPIPSQPPPMRLSLAPPMAQGPATSFPPYER
jgi:hypothetical protein